MTYPTQLPGPGDFISPMERDPAPAPRPYDKYEDASRDARSDRAAALAPRAIAENWSGELFSLAVFRGEDEARRIIAARQAGGAA
jgi:hypothetical protein